MGKPWLKALFADLAPRDDKESQSASSLSSSAEDRHAAHWNSHSRTSCSPPKATYPAENYDIAAHARASLQISNSRRHTESTPAFLASPSHARHASSGPATPSGWRRPAGYTSPTSSYRTTNAPPPLGMRPPLYTQERPYHAEDTIPLRNRQATGPGGFINPQQASPTRRAPISSPSRTPASPQYSPQRHNGASPGNQRPDRTRPHLASTPSRPAFLATPPPRVPHRPQSDPSNSSPTKQPNSPGLSRSGSDENAKPKPNQCHGTTGAGKRCTRIVKAKAAPSSSKAKNTATSPPVASSSDFRLGRDALKQLDRRLSVRTKNKAPHRSPRRGKGRVIEIDSDSDDDSADEFERLSPVQDNAVSDEDGFEELPVFCFQHIKQTLEQRGTFINGTSVDFQGKCPFWLRVRTFDTVLKIFTTDWIPASLPQETQLQLRHEMSKPKGDERRGYIYVHEFPFSGKRLDCAQLALMY